MPSQHTLHIGGEKRMTKEGRKKIKRKVKREERGREEGRGRKDRRGTRRPPFALWNSWILYNANVLPIPI